MAEQGRYIHKGRPQRPHTVVLHTCRDVTLRNVRVTWGDDLPKTYAHSLEAHNAPGLRVENLAGDAAHPGVDPAQMID
jgi:polygalacturonase